MARAASWRYHIPDMANDFTGKSPEALREAAASVLEEAAARLHSILAELAGRVQPFPGFMGMTSLQAIELDPAVNPAGDRGCVVVLPSGEICGLDLAVISGAGIESRVDYVEQFIELDLSPEEHIRYAVAAIDALSRQLR